MTQTIIIQHRYLGAGDDILGEKLMASFLRKLWSSDTRPNSILFYNSGVLLLRDDSTVLDALAGLQDAGVDIIACGTCCTYYDITKRVAVGRISDMQEIVSTVLAADKVITV